MQWNGCQPKNRGKTPQIIPCLIGVVHYKSPSILGVKIPLFLGQHPNLPRLQSVEFLQPSSYEGNFSAAHRTSTMDRSQYDAPNRCQKFPRNGWNGVFAFECYLNRGFQPKGPSKQLSNLNSMAILLGCFWFWNQIDLVFLDQKQWDSIQSWFGITNKLTWKKFSSDWDTFAPKKTPLDSW